jgi:hypothetical protein
MLMGNRLSFDDEAARLYDANPPHLTEQDFQPSLDELDHYFPVRPLPIDTRRFDRTMSSRRQAGCGLSRGDRRLPCKDARACHAAAGETFTVEYVTGKPGAPTTGTRATTPA